MSKTLALNSLLCKPNPMTKRRFARRRLRHLQPADFGISYGQQMGFRQDVKLAIQVEAARSTEAQ